MRCGGWSRCIGGAISVKIYDGARVGGGENVDGDASGDLLGRE